MTPLREQFIRELIIRGRAERTIHAYVASLAAVAKHYGLPPDRLSDEQLRDWLEHLRSVRQLSASSLNVTVNAVRAFQEWVLHRPREQCVRGVPTCKRATKRAEVYAQSEMRAILRAAPPGRDRMLLSLIYACGLRRWEATQVKITDIDAARLQLRVRHGKGAKERVLPLTPQLLCDLRGYWRDCRKGRPGHDSPWLFQGSRPGEPMSTALALHILVQAIAVAKVKRKGGLHTLRHSFATHLLESGVEITVVQRLLGHASLATTARYLHVTTGRIEKLAVALDLLGALRR
jgi:site-specific recombinase XerD